jgi:hypothetical protein
MTVAKRGFSGRLRVGDSTSGFHDFDGTVKALKLQSGDVLVVRVGAVSEAALLSIRERLCALRPQFPQGVACFIMPSNVNLECWPKSKALRLLADLKDLYEPKEVSNVRK